MCLEYLSLSCELYVRWRALAVASCALAATLVFTLLRTRHGDDADAADDDDSDSAAMNLWVHE